MFWVSDLAGLTPQPYKAIGRSHLVVKEGGMYGQGRQEHRKYDKGGEGVSIRSIWSIKYPENAENHSSGRWFIKHVVPATYTWVFIFLELPPPNPHAHPTTQFNIPNPIGHGIRTVSGKIQCLWNAKERTLFLGLSLHSIFHWHYTLYHTQGRQSISHAIRFLRKYSEEAFCSLYIKIVYSCFRHLHEHENSIPSLTLDGAL